MKLLIALSLPALFLNSCRTEIPIDPDTGKPSLRCLPYATSEKRIIEEK